MSSVALLQTMSDVSALLNCPSKPEKLIASTCGARERLKIAGLSYSTGMEYVDFERYSELFYLFYPRYELMLSSWDVPGIFDSSHTRFLQTILHTYWREALRSIIWAENLLAAGTPESIYVSDHYNSTIHGLTFAGRSLNLENKALRLLAKKKGIPVHDLSQPAINRVNDTLSRLLGRSRRAFVHIFSPSPANKKFCPPVIDSPILFAAYDLHLMTHLDGLTNLAETAGYHVVRATWDEERSDCFELRAWHQRNRSPGFIREVSAALKKKLTSSLGHFGNDFYGQAIQELIRDKISLILSKELPESEAIYLSMKLFLKQIKPRLVVLAEDTTRVHVPVIVAARDLGIPTLCVQHGMIVREFPMDWRPNADFLACWCQTSANILSQTFPDITMNRLKVLGKPPAAYKSVSPSREAVRALLGYEYADVLVVFFSVGQIDLAYMVELERACIYERLADAFESSHLHLLIKPHPGQTPGYLNCALAAKRYHRTKAALDLDPGSLISAADIVITNSTTSVIIEAMECRKPIVYFSAAQRTVLTEIIEQGAVVEAREPEDVPELCMRLVQNREKMAEFISRQKNALDSLAIPYQRSADSKWCALLEELMLEQVTKETRPTNPSRKPSSPPCFHRGQLP